LSFKLTIKVKANFSPARLVNKLRSELIKAADAAGQHMVKAVQHRFDVGGPGWAPNADGSPSHLTRTGALRNSIQYVRSGYSVRITPGSAGPGGGVFRRQAYNEQVLKKKFPNIRKYYTSPQQVGVYHEMGTSKMPARPFMGPTAWAEKRHVIKIYKDHIKAVFG
jgi:HK97 gp10 family phage protein